MASVVEVGVHTRELDRRHADRVLPVHELIVVQSGVLPMAEEDRQFAVRQGEWVLLQAGRRHYGHDVMDRDTWFFWVVFGHQNGNIFRHVQRGRRSGFLARPDRVQILFEQLLEDQQAAILTPYAADSYLRLLVAEILLEPSPAPARAASIRLARRAAAFIAQHLTDPDLSTGRIARQ